MTNPIHLFEAAIRVRLPNCTTEIDAPLLEDRGCWWLDVKLGKQWVQVQHLPNVYFLGVSDYNADDPDPNPFAIHPDRVFDDLESALAHATAILTS